MLLIKRIDDILLYFLSLINLSKVGRKDCATFRNSFFFRFISRNISIALISSLSSRFFSIHFVIDIISFSDDEIKFLTIRKTILFYFELFPIKNDFSGSILFANCYCILLIEPPIREIFISFLSNYLNGFDMQRKSNDFTSLLFDKILKLIQNRVMKNTQFQLIIKL